jgi:hypothetical protein
VPGDDTLKRAVAANGRDCGSNDRLRMAAPIRCIAVAHHARPHGSKGSNLDSRSEELDASNLSFMLMMPGS